MENSIKVLEIMKVEVIKNDGNLTKFKRLICSLFNIIPEVKYFYTIKAKIDPQYNFKYLRLRDVVSDGTHPFVVMNIENESVYTFTSYSNVKGIVLFKELFVTAGTFHIEEGSLNRGTLKGNILHGGE